MKYLPAASHYSAVAFARRQKERMKAAQRKPRKNARGKKWQLSSATSA